MVSFSDHRQVRRRKEIPCPQRIVTETCPAPECNLTEQDVEQFLDEMTNYIELFAGAFERPEQLGVESQSICAACWAKRCARMWSKLRWIMGENVRSLQHFIGQSTLEAGAGDGDSSTVGGGNAGRSDGVALIDESGVVKQGDDSVGVAAQYCGAVGKVANCQVGCIPGLCEPQRVQLGEGNCSCRSLV